MLNLNSITNIDFNEIKSLHFDLAIFASGYDARASFLPQSVNAKNICNNMILGFSEFRNSNERTRNDSFYRASFSEPIILGASEDRPIYSQLDHIFANQLSDKKEIKILLDYTSMSRLWYSGILNYLKMMSDKIIEVYICYCLGDYAGCKIHNIGYNSIQSLPSHEGTLTSNDRTTLVVPVGFYADIIRAIKEEIEPNNTIGILGIPSLKKEYEERCLETQRELDGDIQKWIKCPVNDLESIFRTYAEIINNSIDSEVIFLPLGPKTFNMAAILVSQRFEYVTCLYLKTNSNPQNSVGATGDIVCNKIIYRNE